MEDFLYKYLPYYSFLPVPVKQFIGKIYSLLPNRFKYGSFYYKYSYRLNFFHGLESLQGIDKEQNKLLFSQVNQSIDQIPYYKSYKKI